MKKLSIFLLLLFFLSCKKNAIKHEHWYELSFKGTINSFVEGRKEKYEFIGARLKCSFDSEEKIQLDLGPTGGILYKTGENKYAGQLNMIPPAKTKTNELTYYLDGKLKYGPKFRYVLTGIAAISKEEYDLTTRKMIRNPEYFIGTFTLQPYRQKK